MKLYCKTCWFEISNKDLITVHFNSNFHLNNVKFQNDISKNQLLLPFYCTICSIYANSDEILSNHLKSEKHKSRLKLRETIELNKDIFMFVDVNDTSENFPRVVKRSQTFDKFIPNGSFLNNLLFSFKDS
jgi:hypothetical protein